MKILLIEDEKINRVTLADALRKDGHEVEACETGETGMAALRESSYDIVVTDLRLPGITGIEILEQIRSMDRDIQVIIMTAYATAETAIRALKMGAYDYLIKPFNTEELLNTVSHIGRLRSVINENSLLRERLNLFENREIIGNSAVMRQCTGTIANVGPSEYTVLIIGESGTGKELAARALHAASPRKSGPFIAVNSAALPETLMESELFGYEKGAFSGALRQHNGYFERADGGTIFIDDVDDMPLSLQVKLLRVLQEREVVRIGGTKPIPVDIRLVCAAKQDLGKMVDAGAFRRDLFYRLNVVPIFLPPLRDRRDDIPLLLDFFLLKHNGRPEDRRTILTLLPKFMAYHWPGNVRELENIVQRVVAMRGEEIPEQTLLAVAPTGPATVTPAAATHAFDGSVDYTTWMDRLDRDVITWALSHCQANVSAAAKFLQIPRSTLRSKMEKYGIGE